MLLLEKIFNLLQFYSNLYFHDKNIDFEKFWRPIEIILDKYHIEEYSDIKWKRNVFDFQVSVKNIFLVAIRERGEKTIYDYLNEIDVNKISNELSLTLITELISYVSK